MTDKSTTAWTGTADERIALVRRLYDGTIDLDLDLAIYADDIAWYMPQGRGKLMGPSRHGRAAVEEGFAYVMEVISEYNSKTEPWEILAEERGRRERERAHENERGRQREQHASRAERSPALAPPAQHGGHDDERDRRVGEGRVDRRRADAERERRLVGRV